MYIVRKNPHSSRGEMKLYMKRQVLYSYVYHVTCMIGGAEVT